MALPPEVTNHASTVAEMHWGLFHLLILSMILLFILLCIKLKNQDQGCNLPRILYSGHSSDRTGGRCLLPDDLSSVMMMATFVYSAGSENRRLHWHVLISGEKYWRYSIIHPVLWLWRKHTGQYTGDWNQINLCARDSFLQHVSWRLDPRSYSQSENKKTPIIKPVL
ncbi:hypothetical protein EDB85DRAFT_552083 [Lactarius pseudohatsudake]|nr:hypothetical protein EDB85DRAFT_552083 [Lactarius pseudohatsudake]